MSLTTFVTTTGTIAYITSTLPDAFYLPNAVINVDFPKEIISSIVQWLPVTTRDAKEFANICNFCKIYQIHCGLTYEPSDVMKDFRAFLFEDPTLGVAFSMSRIGNSIFSQEGLIGKIENGRVFAFKRCPIIESLSFDVEILCTDGVVSVPSFLASCHSSVPCKKKVVDSAFKFLKEYHYGLRTGICRKSIAVLLDCGSEYIHIFRGKGNITDDVNLLVNPEPLSRLLSKYSVYEDKIYMDSNFLGSFVFAQGQMTLFPTVLWKDVGKIASKLTAKGISVLISHQ